MRWIALLALTGPTAAQVDFVERAKEVGLDHRFQSGLDRIGALDGMNDWVQVGMAPGDTDGDGDLDLLTLGRLAPNHLWRNDGGVFADDTAYAGLASPELDTCCAFADYDADGDLDLFVGVYERGEGPLPGKGRLLRNDGAGRFEDVTELAGSAGRVGAGHTIAGLWYDLDLDGFADLYLSEFGGTPNLLYRNNADGGFTEVAKLVGANAGGSTHASGICDTDGDGYPDIHVGNDFAVTQAAGMAGQAAEVILQGGADGTFADVSAGSELDLESTTMGIAWGDVDYDGLPDVFKTQVGDQFLFGNHGWPAERPWSREEYNYGVVAGAQMNPCDPFGLDWGETIGWGCAFADLDFDPWLDLVFVAGHVTPAASDRKQHDYLFRGLGPGGGFAFEPLPREASFYDLVDDRALVVADLDADGDQDLLIGPPGGDLRYLENRTAPAGRGFLSVRASGRTSARDGAGVVAQWTDGLGLPHVRWIGGDGATASQREHRAIFGLGDAAAVDLSVAFPSGVTLEFPGTPPNTTLVAVEPELLSLSASTLAPLGTLDVTAFAHDAAGNPLDGGAVVTIDAPGLTPLGPVAHAGGNTFVRSFQAGATAGEHRVEASFDGFAVRVRPRVRVAGAVSAAATTLRVLPECVRAGTADAFELRVVPRDASGALLGAGHAVDVSIPGIATHAALADLGDGRYAASFAAPASAGELPVEVFVDGAALGVAGSVEAAGPVAPAASAVYWETPDPGVAMNRHRLPLLVTPRDAAGRRLGPGAKVTVTVFPQPGSGAVDVLDLGPRAQADGEHVFVLERAEGDRPGSARGTFHVAVDGTSLGHWAYAF